MKAMHHSPWRPRQATPNSLIESMSFETKYPSFPPSSGSCPHASTELRRIHLFNASSRGEESLPRFLETSTARPKSQCIAQGMVPSLRTAGCFPMDRIDLKQAGHGAMLVGHSSEHRITQAQAMHPGSGDNRNAETIAFPASILLQRSTRAHDRG